MGHQVFLSKVAAGLAAAAAAPAAGAQADHFVPTVAYIILPAYEEAAVRPGRSDCSFNAGASQEGAHGTLAYLSVSCSVPSGECPFHLEQKTSS